MAFLGKLADHEWQQLNVKVTRKGKNKALWDEARREAKELLQNAKLESESIKKEKKLQAKEHFIELKSNHEREIYKREQPY